MRWSVLFLMGCARCEGEESPPLEEQLDPVCALPVSEGEQLSADANQDGRVDVSDGVFTLRYLINGGPPPSCLEAQNQLPDELLDMSDGFTIFYHLFVGYQTLRDTGRMDCSAPNPIADAPCGRLGMSLDKPTNLEGAPGETLSTELGVWLTTPDLDPQAWSFGVSAEGCRVTAGVEEGSAIADIRLDEAGHRDGGFVRSDTLSDGGLVHGAVLSWRKDATLSAQEDPYRLLTLSVQTTVPSSGCARCTLDLVEGLQGPGMPVALVVTAGGRSYTPTASGTSFLTCAR